MKKVPCNFCGGRNFRFLFGGHDYLSFSPLSFKVIECEGCGLVFLNPRPENITPYYREYHKRTLEKDVFVFLSGDRAHKIKKLKKRGRILDVGCGSGNFLRAMGREGWEVYGNDISQLASESARLEGLKNIYTGDLLSLDFPENFFDVITLWHVLEHLEKPRETLEKIERLLKDDGLLVVESPDFSSLQSRFFKDKWYALDVPRHLYQFSPDSLRKLLAATNFKIIKKDYLVDMRVSFINLKMSLLRWLGIEKIPESSQPDRFSGGSGSRGANFLWQSTRFLFNWSCLLTAFFLNVINVKDVFRVYCRKMEKA